MGVCEGIEFKIGFGGERCYSGLVLEIVGMGDVLLVEVNILVLSGFLMKQPKDIPRSLNCWQRKEKEVFKWDYS